MRKIVRLRVSVEYGGVHVARSWRLRRRVGSLSGSPAQDWCDITGAPESGRYTLHAALDEAGRFWAAQISTPVPVLYLRANAQAMACWLPRAWLGRRVSVAVRAEE